MYTVRRSGPSSHPNCAPFSIHSRILALSSDRWSKGDISSTTKSGHRCGNLRFSLLVSLSTRERRTQGGIRRVRGPARKEVLHTGIEHQAASVFLRPISQLHRQLTVAPTGFSPRRGHDQDVAFRRAFDAQVRNGHAKPVILSVGHKALADLHGSDYPAYCPAKDTAAGALASCVAISGNFSTNISRSESTNGATTIGRTDDAKGRTSMA